MISFFGSFVSKYESPIIDLTTVDQIFPFFNENDIWICSYHILAIMVWMTIRVSGHIRVML